jgi:hypothetical protein
MNINKRLVRAIAESGLDFEDVAIFSGILSTALVGCVQGKATLDQETMGRIADVLGKSVEELWPEPDGVISNQCLGSSCK